MTWGDLLYPLHDPDEAKYSNPQHDHYQDLRLLSLYDKEDNRGKKQVGDRQLRLVDPKSQKNLHRIRAHPASEMDDKIKARRELAMKYMWKVGVSKHHPAKEMDSEFRKIRQMSKKFEDHYPFEMWGKWGDSGHGIPTCNMLYTDPKTNWGALRLGYYLIYKCHIFIKFSAR